LEDKGGYLGISDSRAPGPGELWEGGPHHALTKRLNQDPKLNEALMAFALDDDNPLNIVVFSDRRGESIRISGHSWLEAEDVSELYAAPVYLEIVGRIGQQVKEVRRAFGGLTF
jgi:hypothetical protein